MQGKISMNLVFSNSEDKFPLQRVGYE